MEKTKASVKCMENVLKVFNSNLKVSGDEMDNGYEIKSVKGDPHENYSEEKINHLAFIEDFEMRKGEPYYMARGKWHKMPMDEIKYFTTGVLMSSKGPCILLSIYVLDKWFAENEGTFTETIY